MLTSHECSLKSCHNDAAFELYAGHNHFDTDVRAFTCAFDRVQVTDILSRKYESVVWHDIEEVAGC